MLTAEGCAARRKRLWAALPAVCDAIVIGDPQHLIYFANLAVSPFAFRASDAAALLILEPEQATLVADNLLQPYLDQTHVDRTEVPTWYVGTHSAPWRRQERLIEAALETLSGLAPHRLGYEAGSVPAGVVEGLRARRPELELVEIDPVVRRLRRTKDADELAILRRAINAAATALDTALLEVRPGQSELEIFQMVERTGMAAVGDRALVYGDVEFGTPRRQPMTVVPPCEHKVHEGDLLILDFSIVVHGYRGDFANTLSVGGRPSARQRELLQGCLAAMAAGEAMLRPGMPARDIDAAMRQAFGARGLDPHYSTHSGHGIGLSHPEPPYIVPESDDTLLPGDVVTLEPGQYGPDFGGMRIERNYLITDEGYETLSHHKIQLH